MIIPYKRQIPALVDLKQEERDDLADVLRRFVISLFFLHLGGRPESKRCVLLYISSISSDFLFRVC